MVEAQEDHHKQEEREQEQEEVPFQLVRSKRMSSRRQVPTPSSSSSSVSATSTTTITTSTSTSTSTWTGKERSYSNASGSITGATLGFTYSSSNSSSQFSSRASARRRGKRNAMQLQSSSSATNQQQARETTLKRAHDAIQVFVKYLCSDLSSPSAGNMEKGEKATFAQQLHSTLRTVWPTTSSTIQPTEQATNPNVAIPKRIVCLGLGSPTNSRAAQIQLALLIVVRTYLTLLDTSNPTSIANKKETQQTTIECLASDPIFTPLDVSLLQTYSIQPTDSSAIQDSYSHIKIPTLLYMPHCDRDLYEHVLSLNYPPTPTPTPTPSCSPPILLLCNVLNNYATFTRNLDICSPTLYTLIPNLTTLPLPNCDTAKRSVLIHEASDYDGTTIAEFVRLWDRHALHDLAFHWLQT